MVDSNGTEKDRRGISVEFRLVQSSSPFTSLFYEGVD